MILFNGLNYYFASVILTTKYKNDKSEIIDLDTIKIYNDKTIGELCFDIINNFRISKGLNIF